MDTSMLRSIVRDIVADDEDARELARQRLRSCGDGRTVMGLICDADARVRRGALILVGEMAHRDDILAAIRLGLSDSEEWVRYEACCLCELLRDLPSDLIQPLCVEAESANWAVRQMAITAIGAAGAIATEAARVVEALLSDSDSRVRFAAAGAASKVDGPPPRLLDRLSACFHDDNADVRRAAYSSFLQLCSAKAASLEAIVGALNDSVPDVRIAGLCRVTGEAVGSKMVLMALRDNLGHFVPQIRVAARKLLSSAGNIGIPYFADALVDGTDVARCEAARGLAAQGSVDVRTIAVIEAVACSGIETVELFACCALWCLTNDQNRARHLIQAAIRSDNGVALEAALAGIWILGRRAAEFAPDLRLIAEESVYPYCDSAISLLLRVRSHERSTIECLAQIVRTAPPERAVVAVRAIAAFGAKARAAVPALMEVLQRYSADDDEDGMREACHRALAKSAE